MTTEPNNLLSKLAIKIRSQQTVNRKKLVLSPQIDRNFPYRTIEPNFSQWGNIGFLYNQKIPKKNIKHDLQNTKMSKTNVRIMKNEKITYFNAFRKSWQKLSLIVVIVTLIGMCTIQSPSKINEQSEIDVTRATGDLKASYPVTIDLESNQALIDSTQKTGSGTQEDPYVFTNIEFYGYNNALTLKNIDKYVIIRNNSFLDVDYGISLINCTNINISGNSFSNIAIYAIWLENSWNNVVEQNSITHNSVYGSLITGIGFWNSSRINVTLNTVALIKTGLRFESDSREILVWNNDFYQNSVNIQLETQNYSDDSYFTCQFDNHSIGNWYSNYQTLYPVAVPNNINGTWDSHYKITSTWEDHCALVYPARLNITSLILCVPKLDLVNSFYTGNTFNITQSFRLEWNTIIGATSYRIYKVGNASVYATTTECNFTFNEGINIPGGYSFQVVAVNMAGESLKSNTISVTIRNNTIPTCEICEIQQDPSFIEKYLVTFIIAGVGLIIIGVLSMKLRQKN